MAESLRWALVLMAVGLGGALPSAGLFGTLRSAGVLYALPLGLLAVAYTSWLLAWGTPLDYGPGLVLLAVAILGGANGLLWWQRPQLAALVRGQWRLWALGQALFLVAFALLVLVRAQAPAAINTEKPMDLMLLNAVHNADAMPPEDPWFAGERLSYYHLGHTGVSVLAHLARVPTGVAFNLGLASTGAMATVAAFGLGGDVAALVRRTRGLHLLAGGAAALAVLALGTLEGGIELLAANGIGQPSSWSALGVNGLPDGLAARDGVPSGFWWWWRSTRVIPDTINEFPAFSLVLGDLHAHVLALPLALVAIAVAVTAFEGGRPLTWRAWLVRPEALTTVALLFAGLAMTNSWDAALYGALWFAAGMAAFLGTGWGILGAGFGMARHIAVPAVVAYVLAWPFIDSLERIPLGVAPVTEPASDLVRFALVWLPPALLPLAAAALLRPRLDRRVVGLTALLGIAAVVAWMIAAVATEEPGALGDRGAGWLTLGLLVGGTALGAGATAEAYRGLDRGRAAWLALATAAAAILLVTELFRLVDAFPGRMNTVFKFGYGTWLLLAIASGGAAHELSTAIRRGALGAFGAAALAPVAFVLALCVLFLPAAAVSRAREGQPRGLDSTAALAVLDPSAVAVAEWARATLGGDAVLLLASGQSYRNNASLVATLSGVPTVVGWPGHEVQWREDGTAVGRREQDVRRIYEAGATPEALDVARSYGVTHVYVGAEEARLYGPDTLARFASWPMVFEVPRGAVLAVPPASEVSP